MESVEDSGKEADKEDEDEDEDDGIETVSILDGVKDSSTPPHLNGGGTVEPRLPMGIVLPADSDDKVCVFIRFIDIIVLTNHVSRFLPNIPPLPPLNSLQWSSLPLPPLWRLSLLLPHRKLWKLWRKSRMKSPLTPTCSRRQGVGVPWWPQVPSAFPLQGSIRPLVSPPRPPLYHHHLRTTSSKEKIVVSTSAPWGQPLRTVAEEVGIGTIQVGRVLAVEWERTLRFLVEAREAKVDKVEVSEEGAVAWG